MKKFLLLCACLATSGLQASDCKYKEMIDQTLDLAGSESLSVNAAAGELKITGLKGGNVAVIKGRICVSEEEWLAKSGVETNAGEQAEITVVLPDTDDGHSWSGNNYAHLDLELEVPEGIRLNVRDSSGEMRLEGVSVATVQDSSGGLYISDATGPINIRDSSGVIDLTDINGDVTIESDSSGDILGRDIRGTVLVESDSSGDIDFTDVSANFVVERDSSGDISANRVGGDFEVQRDGSGEIRAENVTGEVSTPSD